MALHGTILALDLATRLGWAMCPIGNAPSQITFGEHVLPSTGNDIGKFICAFEDWLGATIDTECLSLVVFEAPILPQRTQLSTIRKLYGLATEAERVCRRRAVRVEEARMQTVRKAIIGKGNAQKEDTMRVCRLVYGLPVRTDNEADACAVLAYALHCHAPAVLRSMEGRRLCPSI